MSVKIFQESIKQYNTKLKQDGDTMFKQLTNQKSINLIKDVENRLMRQQEQEGGFKLSNIKPILLPTTQQEMEINDSQILDMDSIQQRMTLAKLGIYPPKDTLSLVGFVREFLAKYNLQNLNQLASLSDRQRSDLGIPVVNSRPNITNYHTVNNTDKRSYTTNEDNSVDNTLHDSRTYPSKHVYNYETNYNDHTQLTVNNPVPVNILKGTEEEKATPTEEGNILKAGVPVSATSGGREGLYEDIPSDLANSSYSTDVSMFIVSPGITKGTKKQIQKWRQLVEGTVADSKKHKYPSELLAAGFLVKRTLGK